MGLEDDKRKRNAANSMADYERHKPARLAAMRRYNETHRKERSQYQRLRCYKLTLEAYEEKIIKQGGVCASCGGPLVDPHIDHDHKCCNGKKTCGKCTRGVLCGRCNRGLGNFNDDPELLDKGAAYLREWEGSQL